MVFVDTHAHLRGCFEVRAFLEGALTNFAREVESIDEKSGMTSVLCLMDPPRARGYERLSRFVAEGEGEKGEGKRVAEKGAFQRTAEEESLHLRLGQSRNLIVIAGRQIESQEHLEVLAVGTRGHFTSEAPLEQLIREIATVGGLPIVPWGAGKWWGTRGERLRELLQDADLPRFFLGDSAQRPSVWPKPSHFSLAGRHDVRTLLGTDPLPLSDEAKRVGSCGVRLSGRLDLEKPAHDLKRTLLDPATPLRYFGERETLPRVLRNQALMQYRKFVQ